MARRGIIDVHSVFSYDGVHTLDELATFGRKCGYSFIGVTEHSDTFGHIWAIEGRYFHRLQSLSPDWE